jgi:hypothetical protein
MRARAIGTARVQEDELHGKRQFAARHHPAALDWHISLARAEQTLLAEIVLPAPESQSEEDIVQELDKDHRPRSNAWIRDTTSHAFEDDEAFGRRTGGPV